MKILETVFVENSVIIFYPLRMLIFFNGTITVSGGRTTTYRLDANRADFRPYIWGKCLVKRVFKVRLYTAKFQRIQLSLPLQSESNGISYSLVTVGGSASMVWTDTGKGVMRQQNLAWTGQKSLCMRAVRKQKPVRNRTRVASGLCTALHRQAFSQGPTRPRISRDRKSLFNSSSYTLLLQNAMLFSLKKVAWEHKTTWEYHAHRALRAQDLYQLDRRVSRIY